MRYTKEDILRQVEEEEIDSIRLQFTDLFGMIKNVVITSSHLEKALNNECMFDGSAVEGFVRIEESDMYLYPDLDTFTIFPWRPQEGKSARLICDVYRPNGERFDGDSRYVLQKVLKRAEEKGIYFESGPECEFFLFKSDEQGNPTTYTDEQAGFFDVGPMDYAEDVRRDIVLQLEELGINVEASHHELAPAQQEIDLHYTDPLATADNINTLKFISKTVAKGYGLHATFMPKPKFGVNGSGMHLNISIHDKAGNLLFPDASDPRGISHIGYNCIAGVMAHVKGCALITNPLINSYKRLIPGYEAPDHIAWSRANRSPLIRIPAVGRQNCRMELRFPDPSCNPYLALAVCIAAALDGIERDLMPPEEVVGNIYNMSPEELKERGIESMPRNLGIAMECLKADAYICDVLGEHVVEKMLEAKTQEWRAYCSQVTAWELGEYLRKY